MKIIFKYLSKITLPKAINIFKFIISYQLSIILKKPIIFSNPFYFSIEPTNSCNLKCPECPCGMGNLERKKGKIELKEYSQIISQIKTYGIHLYLYFQGEPFLNKDLPKMIQIAENSGLIVTTSTNANLINQELANDIVKSKLHKIIISLDGMDQETYEKYRIGGSLEKVKQAVDFLAIAKEEFKSKFPILEIQFLVTGQNEHQINDAKKWFKHSGANTLYFKTAQIYDLKKGSSLIPKNDKFSRYKLDKNSKFVLKKEIKNKCQRLWSTSVICYDGTLAACCYDKDARHSYGNILQEQLSSLWKSKTINSLRQQILRDRKSIDICNNCNE